MESNQGGFFCHTLPYLSNLTRTVPVEKLHDFRQRMRVWFNRFNCLFCEHISNLLKNGRMVKFWNTSSMLTFLFWRRLGYRFGLHENVLLVRIMLLAVRRDSLFETWIYIFENFQFSFHGHRQRIKSRKLGILQVSESTPTDLDGVHSEKQEMRIALLYCP